MTATIDDVLDFLARNQEGMKIVEKQRQLQRRNTVTETKADFRTMLRGVDRIYTAYRIPRDSQFTMSYSFGLHTRPFTTSFPLSSTTLPTSLSVNNDVITPNPHSHGIALGVEVNEHPLDTTGLRISIDDIDITDAIISEYGSFVDGYGYFPSKDGVFDMFRIIDYLYPWQQSAILSPGLKEIQITQDENSLCECEISINVKNNHIDRGGLY